MKEGFELSGREGQDHDPCGFAITFDNGWTISVQWGPINFGSNRRKQWNATAHSAEVAIFDPNGNYHRPNASWHDNVCGYLTPAEVLLWTNYTANQP